MPVTRVNPATVRAPAGYNHSIVVTGDHKRVIIAGQVGVKPDGTIPESGNEQIAQVFANLVAILAAHGMTTANLVKTTVFLTERSLLPTLRAERGKMMGDVVPASTLLFVSGLADPRFVVEIEGEAIG